MPQVKMVCKSLGFRKYPTVKFQEVDIKDEVQFQRVITRLLEIGVIAPEQGVEAIRTGLFPHPDSLKEAQEKYTDERADGLYNPLVGGVPAVEPPGSEEDRDLREKQIEKNSQKVSAPNTNQKKTPNEAGRPTGATAKELYSRKNIQSTVYDIEKLRALASKGIKEKFSVKKLNKEQSNIVDRLIESIVVSEEKNNWDNTLQACIKDSENMMNLETINKILNISTEHQLPDYPSAILYHSKK